MELSQCHRSSQSSGPAGPCFTLRPAQIAEKAAGENRALTDTEQHEFDAAVAEIADIDARVAKARSDESRARGQEQRLRELGGGVSHRSLDRAEPELADEFRSAVLERNPKPIMVRWEEPRSATISPVSSAVTW